MTRYNIGDRVTLNTDFIIAAGTGLVTIPVMTSGIVCNDSWPTGIVLIMYTHNPSYTALTPISLLTNLSQLARDSETKANEQKTIDKAEKDRIWRAVVSAQ